MTLTIQLERRTRLAGPSRLRSWAGSLRRKAARIAEAAVAPHKTALSNLTRMPLTVAAVALGDTGAFIQLHGWGYLITVVSLLWLETRIADE